MSLDEIGLQCKRKMRVLPKKVLTRKEVITTPSYTGEVTIETLPKLLKAPKIPKSAKSVKSVSIRDSDN